MKRRIPTLQAALDSHEFGKHLQPVLPPQWGSLQDIQFRVIQHHRSSRCVVDIRLRTTTGSYELVGKIYAEDRSDVYRAMKQISQAGFGPEEEFSIPEPFAFISELNLLLQEKVHGPMIREIFLNGNERQRAEAAERCARWLTHFHTRAPTSGPVFDIRTEFERWVNRLERRKGPRRLLDKAAWLCEALQTAASELDRDGMCACHGTYCHYQIILNPNRMVAVDWDGFCISHPSLDLARFIVILRQLALQSRGSLNALDTAVERFSETYTAESRFDASKHLPFYKAAHYLKHTNDHLSSGNGNLEMAEIMLDEGLRSLAREIRNDTGFGTSAFKRPINFQARHRILKHRQEKARTSVDPSASALQIILHPEALRRHLNPVLPSDWGLLRQIQINKLYHVHGMQRMIDIRLQTTTGNYKLVGKIYGRDREDVYQAMTKISQSGFGSGEEFSIPQPFAYIPELNLLLQEKVEGSLVTEVFLEGDERERATAAERSARWLLHFQTHAPLSGSAFVLAPLEHWAKRLRKRLDSRFDMNVVESLLRKARLLFRQLEMAELGLDRTNKCACHGDFTHHQIALTDSRTVTFGWDDNCVADPAWDVARFIMSVQMLALESLGSIRALDTAIEVFYQTYASRSRFKLGRRLAFHKAAYCLKLAAKHFLKLGSNEKAEIMLDEGLRILAEEGQTF